MAKVIGSCILTFYHNGQANVMIVDNLKVDKNHRRHGIGTTLMKEAIKIAKKRRVDSIELVVNSDNTIAKRLYKKVGFKKTKKDHYRFILRKFR